jgi:hypothetical protein
MISFGHQIEVSEAMGLADIFDNTIDPQNQSNASVRV